MHGAIWRRKRCNEDSHKFTAETNSEEGTVKKQSEEVKRVKRVWNGETNDEEVKKEWRWSSEEWTKVKNEIKERSLNVWCDVLGFR